MAQTVLRAERLGKRYVIGHRRAARTAREAMAGAASRLVQTIRRKASGGRTTDELWALKDISFDVSAGEIVGLIGRNGAGKSTLLKILSRITEPSAGFVDITGRIGSLLEVGTGFHEDLTGRENMYLNGAILGMSKAEIDRKFDEIVAFAEVERFIDTPVKHYSSGMYMRLAFAVAAHLETEILVVDEVLAVGDAQFQKKCLGKIGEVSRGGRTVLFVTHNMAIVQRLATSAILLDRGQLVGAGPVRSIVARYLSDAGSTRYTAAARTGLPQCLSAELIDARGPLNSTPLNTDSFGFRLRYVVPRRHPGLKLGVGVLAADATTLFTTSPDDFSISTPADPGEYEAVVMLPPDTLLAGDYHLAFCLWDAGGTHDLQEPALSFAVDVGPSMLYAIGIERKGFVNVQCRWHLNGVLESQAVE